MKWTDEEYDECVAAWNAAADGDKMRAAITRAVDLVATRGWTTPEALEQACDVIREANPAQALVIRSALRSQGARVAALEADNDGLRADLEAAHESPRRWKRQADGAIGQAPPQVAEDERTLVALIERAIAGAPHLLAGAELGAVARLASGAVHALTTGIERDQLRSELQALKDDRRPQTADVLRQKLRAEQETTARTLSVLRGLLAHLETEAKCPHDPKGGPCDDRCSRCGVLISEHSSAVECGALQESEDAKAEAMRAACIEASRQFLERNGLGHLFLWLKAEIEGATP